MSPCHLWYSRDVRLAEKERRARHQPLLPTQSVHRCPCGTFLYSGVRLMCSIRKRFAASAGCAVSACSATPPSAPRLPPAAQGALVLRAGELLGVSGNGSGWRRVSRERIPWERRASVARRRPPSAAICYSGASTRCDHIRALQCQRPLRRCWHGPARPGAEGAPRCTGHTSAGALALNCERKSL